MSELTPKQIKIRAEYRRLRNRLSHNGTIKRLAEGFVIPERWVREVVGDIARFEDTWRL